MIITCSEKNVKIDTEAADSFLKRFMGLMMRKELETGRGLLLSPCSSIHCMFMRFDIDVLYLDRDRRIIKRETVKPWRIGSIVSKCAEILEINKGDFPDLCEGDILSIEK